MSYYDIQGNLISKKKTIEKFSSIPPAEICSGYDCKI